MNYQEIISKYKYYLIAGGVGLLLCCSVLLFLIKKPIEAIDEDFQTDVSSTQQIMSSESAHDQRQLYVDIKGAVKQPGMYEVKMNMRVWDAVMLAGGFKEGADTKQVNFAEQLTDQMVIYVPLEGEDPPIKKNMTGEEDVAAASKVNLNLADESQLQTLSGIGLKKAQEIIRYREENGGFKSIEEIKNISGFGEKTFERLKEAITI
ncbi:MULTISPECIES: helix-hairpin-helix domain-containing protein [unclassified Enterococcus]|uniref:helix-hairpin-helix domain-containing protein n=1 Tax=unclassified Enterococcus TaxID=2608891 RepID=UPI001CE1D87E|nr:MULTISPECIES: helix-hairpin-helix domain-containing protein [unclassified Enterococcus]MCA5012632.1 helix-hairpin-helix domain-containing protein [Enterococcus sp. S23]MCA5015883.1 helix-hairpin-helix domain-containing protein [Enterococcus sp. S22(2020)]